MDDKTKALYFTLLYPMKSNNTFRNMAKCFFDAIFHFSQIRIYQHWSTHIFVYLYPSFIIFSVLKEPWESRMSVERKAIHDSNPLTAKSITHRLEWQRIFSQESMNNINLSHIHKVYNNTYLDRGCLFSGLVGRDRWWW